MLNNTILNIFAKSPLKPLQKHMVIIHRCVSELVPFLNSVLAADWDTAEEHKQNIMQFEAEGDNMKKEIRLHLPTSLFLPMSRSDLLGLLTEQDKIASKAKHIAGLVFTRRMQIPEEIKTDFTKFYVRCIDASELAKQAINELDELVETGFKGKEAKIVENMILELDTVERDTDNMQVSLRELIFNIETKLNPINVIFLYKLIDWTGELADRAQHVGQRLESLLAN